jgi:hypothetical protein
MDLDRSQAAGEDLVFVRRALEREARGPFPRSIAFLWAALSLVGFALIDFRPEWAAPFWLIASPVGFGLSIWLGRRAARAAGRTDRAESARWSAHWAGFLGAFALVAVAAGTGKLGWGMAGTMLLLLLAITYYTAGVHLHRGLLPVAALPAGGYLVVLFVEGRHWTWIGAALAAAMIAAAFVGGAGRRA